MEIKKGRKGGLSITVTSFRATFFGFSYKPTSGKGKVKVHPSTGHDGPEVE
jgi:hypothetical protein